MSSQSAHLLNTWSSLTVLVLGDAMLDCYLDGNSQRLSQEAPVPIVTVTQCEDLPGGAANTAANVASLGGQTLFLSVVGLDEEGSRLQQSLNRRQVNTDYLITCCHRRTITKQRVMGNSHLLARFDHGTTEAIAPDLEQHLIQTLEQLFPQCDAVIVSDYGYGLVTPAVVEALTRLQQCYQKVLVVDSRHLELYQAVGVTAVKPNYAEATRLLGISHQGEQRATQMAAYGDRLLQLTGAKLVALTLDRDGAMIFERNYAPIRTYTEPAPFSHTAGAGDTFVSALTLALAAQASTAIAASIAATAAAIVVSQEKTTTCSLDDLYEAVVEPTKLVSSYFDLSMQLQRHRSAGKRIVFTNGCFDILHAGHVTHLTQAKALGDVLIVGINTDESIRQLKGDQRPVNPLDDRVTVLAALGCVDHVIPFAERSPRDLIQLIRPDVYVKGGDYTRETLPEASLVESLGGVVQILPHIGDRSTTRLIRHIQSFQSCSEATPQLQLTRCETA